MTRVVLTLSEGALAGLALELARDDLTIEERPLLRFEPPPDWQPLDRALAALAGYRAIAFTSPRAAEAAVSRWRHRADRRECSATAWAAGPATAAALGDWFGPVRMPAADQTGEGAGAALGRAMVAAGTQSPVLYPCGEVHRDELTRRLGEAGIDVDEIVCYRSVLAAPDAARAALDRADILVVGSPRVAELLCAVDSQVPARRPRLLALGPTTAAASRQHGWTPDAQASRPTPQEVGAQLRALAAAR